MEQFSQEQQITDKINIVKEAKYLFDSVCDLHLKSDIQQNSLPEILGNAVVLVKTRKSNEYISYFVENGFWVKDGINLKSIRIRNINLENIRFYDKSGLVQKSERNAKQIESITKAAQLKRDRASINRKYDALKRKRKQLEQNLEKRVLDARNVKEESSNTKSSSNAHNFFNYAKNTVKTTVQSICNQFGYETFGINNLPSVIFNLLSEIIESNLEISFVDQAEYYIDILRNITGEDFDKKIKRI